MKVNNVIIISTSHVAKESVEKVRKTIESEKPGIVAVELDHKRLHALFSPQKKIPLTMIKRVGFKGFLFLVIGRWAQQRIGKLVGVVPGAEMREAVMAAKRINAKVALIDQDIEVTMRRFSKAMSGKEKLRMLKELLLAMLGRGETKKLADFDLSKVPASRLIKDVMAYMKKNYPNLYRILVEERNIVMATNIAKLIKMEPDKKIVAIVGAGHGEGLIERLKELHNP
jgi:pheromone shutdown-related protein TraB